MLSNLFSTIVNVLGQSLVETGMTLISILPFIILAVLLFVAGWFCGSILGRAVAHLITVLRIDSVLHKAGLDTLSERAGFHITLSGFFGGLIKWAVILAFTIAAADILNLTKITELLRDILLYIPAVLVAAIVLVLATLVGDFVARLIDHSTKATGLRGHFAAQVAKWSIIIVGGIFPALTELRIAQGLVEVLFTGIVFSMALALGLAFGLGGRDAASRVIEKMK